MKDMKTMLQAVKQVQEILKNPDALSEIFYNFIKEVMKDEKGRKYITTIVVLTAKKHKDVIENYIELIRILSETVKKYAELQ